MLMAKSFCLPSNTIMTENSLVRSALFTVRQAVLTCEAAARNHFITENCSAFSSPLTTERFCNNSPRKLFWCMSYFIFSCQGRKYVFWVKTISSWWIKIKVGRGLDQSCFTKYLNCKYITDFIFCMFCFGSLQGMLLWRNFGLLLILMENLTWS